MHRCQLLLRSIFLFFLWGLTPVVGAVALPVQYHCGLATQISLTTWPESGWINTTRETESAAGKVPIGRGDYRCWVRIDDWTKTSPKVSEADLDNALSFGDLNVQRVDVELLDANGHTLGVAKRVGASTHAWVTGSRAIFSTKGVTAFPLYARIDPVAGSAVIPGLAQNLLVEAVPGPETLRDEQRDDLLNQSGAMFMFSTALIALFFGYALRDADYAIYALYATTQGLTIFSKSGLAFILESTSWLWLNAWALNYVVAFFSVLLSVRFGRFAVHSPKTTRVAYGLAAAFLLVIPLHFALPAWGSIAIYVLVPLHFLTLLSGNWRGWRAGERGCGILLIGLAPIAVYWVVYVHYGVVLHEPMPSELALGSKFDFFRTLLLPTVFCYGLADRTLRLQQETARLARFDALTELNNREGLRQYGQQLIDAGGHPCTLVLNIERFHAINETLGPLLGDEILRETGQRLKRVCKTQPGARVGRMHADQFCLLLTQVDRLSDIRAHIEREFALPAEVEGQAVDITLAVGVAKPGEERQSMAQRQRNAEIALDAGRAQHKRWMEYRVELESSQRADLDLLSELKRAVEHNELQMYLQPKVRVSDGSVQSAEALVRWSHPKRGLVPPGDFVPFAEKTGGVTLLTSWMLRRAMEYVKDRRAQGRPLQVSVNVSTFDLGEAGFAARVVELARTVGADPGDIRIEITESGAMQDPAAALEIMNDLTSAGFTLSIDDFGTGYSSLAYLQKMPVSELKIDRAFVRNVEPGTDGASLLDSTIAMGHRLGLSVVAEGVETAQEWAVLKSLHCDYVQGWLAAKPMPVADFEMWCTTSTPFMP